MRVHEALLVEGTSRFDILCYGVFRATDLESVSHAFGIEENSNDATTHMLFEEDWPYCVLLIEASTNNIREIQSAVMSSFSRMFMPGNCLTALCMYDGAFGGIDDIFSDVLAEQIYAFCFSEGDHVVNFDEKLISSNEWKLVVAGCRKRLDGHTAL